MRAPFPQGLALRHHPAPRASYRRLVAVGKPKKRALTAAARKLVIAVISRGQADRSMGMASLVVRPLSEATKGRLRHRAARHRRSLEAEVRAILERSAHETELPSAEADRFPDWFIRMTRPGIDLDEAIDKNHISKGFLTPFSRAELGASPAGSTRRGARQPLFRTKSGWHHPTFRCKSIVLWLNGAA